jgi:hypothetical protein
MRGEPQRKLAFHTCASLQFDRGANAKQVQRWLGHHKPSFTLDTYIHLLSDDLGEPLDLAAELQGGFKVASRRVSVGLEGDGHDGPDSALRAGWPSPDETERDAATGS